jgi:type II secretory pathway component PulK
MVQLQIQLSDEDVARLRSQAEQMGLGVEELASSLLAQSISVPTDEEFNRLSQEVLKKNAELYKRLA